MTSELVGILTVGVALAGLFILVWRTLTSELTALRDDMREDRRAMHGDLMELRKEMRADIKSLRDEIRENQKEMREDMKTLGDAIQGPLAGMVGFQGEMTDFLKLLKSQRQS